VELIPIATNFRNVNQYWQDCHGAAVASCLMLLQGGYRTGLIASSRPYQALIPWGSNPVTDPLLSSDNFQIIHDGTAFNRTQKIEQVAKWSEALAGLRVCWQGPHKARNCGRCEKCIRTILDFRVLGLSLPDCFEQDVTEQQILQLKGLKQSSLYHFELILEVAKANNLSDSWVRALEKCVIRNRPLTSLKAVLKDRLRKLTIR